ncbi:MAG: enoyl-CoA hydratase/isomerase family protein [Dehalococcoidia bacterium]|jgi:2-(1,2-epoxy-1,2-dihydrophenyl)acetyl-CoA isomerase|nr:enoyl-CoA hydratase/isomerase family protein [Dehalococcoidia bacterium]
MGASEYPDYEALQVEVRDDGVVLATLDRPERLNSFDGPMRHSIRALVQRVKADDDARVLVFTGAGRGFCSGADLGAEDQRTWPSASHETRFAWTTELLEMPKPTIAAINGVAAGGGLGLALLCDIRICSTEARLLPIWLKRAVHPDDLITWTLPRQAGYSRALRWLYLAEDIPLEEAREAGLISSIVPPERVLDEALELASRLAAGPTAHFGLAKQAVLRGLNREPWDGALLETWGAEKVADLHDSIEGRAAFREKREPEFKGS